MEKEKFDYNALKVKVVAVALFNFAEGVICIHQFRHDMQINDEKITFHLVWAE